MADPRTDARDAAAAGALAAVTADMADFQHKLTQIQMGKAPPPKWFKKVAFDSAIVSIPDLGDFELIAATSGTIEKLDRAEKPEVEAELEADAVIESIQKIPDAVKFRRPFKMKGTEFKADEHVPNFWEIYGKDKATAREVMRALLGGKTYAMLKMAMQWLSKLDVPTMIGEDPEPGSTKEGGGIERPTA